MIEKTTQNEYLGGVVQIVQPAKGYRAGVDPVLLAASIPARSGQSVLELGTGVGTAALCLARRVNGISITGIELQEDYAALARHNGELNGVEFEVLTHDLADLPADFRQRQFDHVIANPPYFDRTAGHAAADKGRETAMGEDTPLATWLKVASKRVAPKGYVTFIHRSERLGDLLARLPSVLGSIQIQPLTPRAGRDSHLIILRARHSGRSPTRLHSPIVMHENDAHLADAEDYTDHIKAVLRDGEPLNMPA